ncbi:hypothetical protein GMD78_13430 [Ornithinibacillus sp. L9]|uniref:Tail specific protease domain-containing protein n=1 Tax=Ornithinibacillus caprae TaxID=2678566 RepID=A0A6N8FLW3_9BACI|nr:S41 family peptidase [Ornithinibacillus caprae]MUK89364.1 hypothetical protein [Ornithinibacillus caprae]
MYISIFQEVVDIMHHDYAGWIDKKGWDRPEKYEENIRYLEKKGELTAETFVEIVQDYLLDFKDHHMNFTLVKSDQQKEYDNGFRVRRYEDHLYIISVGREERLKPGNVITHLDNTTVPELVKKHQRELMETKAEREDWRAIIKKYSVATVINNEGETRSIDLKKYEKAEYVPKHTVTRVDSDTLCMTLTDFFDPDTIQKLEKEYRDELSEIKNVIIDVRVNYGGSTLAYSCLEKYLFPSKSMTINFNDYAMKFNCTKRNTDILVESINQEIHLIADEETRKGLERFEQAWIDNRGKGFTSFDSHDEKVEITGSDKPKNIIVLCDNYCGSAGDIFVYLCKKSPKVTVIGRPTWGLNDYSNLIVKKWDNQFEFAYPTSRLDQLDHREVLTDPGIKPDIYIPWTPKHFEKDVDMEEAMRMLRSREKVT